MADRRGSFEPGLRDRVVTIEYRSTTDQVDAEGAPTETWTTLVGSMPAAKSDITGWERVRASQTSARYDTRWEINYRLDMDPELVDVAKLRRLVVSGRVHDIVAASEIGRREGIELLTMAASG
jgi:SPP1 family predicted phage head-tail adaptor